jgi:hypothetical protein
MFEAVMQKMVELGHDVNAEHWTGGERGFSNVCLNCGCEIGVLKSGHLWGAALNAPCPYRRWYAVSNNKNQPSETRTKNITDVRRPEDQTVKGMVLFLGLLAILITAVAVLVHFHMLSGFLVVFARIGLAISAILLIVAIFRRAGFKPALLMLGASFAFALLSIVFMSPKQKAEWQAQEEAAQKIKAERKAQKTTLPVQPQENEALNQPASAGNTTPVNMTAVFGGLYTQSLRKNGRDVTVYDGDSHTLLR